MRRFMLVLIGLLLICSFCLAEEDAVSSATLKIDRLPKIESQDSRILVVYFSPDDTVRAAAYTIAAEAGAGLFEIVPEELYTADDLNYMNNSSRSMKEMRDKNARPAIAACAIRSGAARRRRSFCHSWKVLTSPEKRSFLSPHPIPPVLEAVIPRCTA